MKSLKIALAIISIALITACGGSPKTNEAHSHHENCTHSHDATSADTSHHQESFTVDADSTHTHHADTCKTDKTKPHTHTHADGKPHKH